MSVRVLVVEDDPAMARVLCDNLCFQEYEVSWSADGSSAVNAIREFNPDLILLDIGLPDGSGFELVGLLRRGHHAALIMLTARSQKADKLRGFELGADDYITKPFDLEELLARIRTVLRRTRPGVDVLTLGSVIVDFRARTATGRDRDLHLTNQELELLKYLAMRREQVVDRDELLREVWGYPAVPTTRSVDYAIARLRKKIEPDPRHPKYIHTVHGDGYCLTPDA